MPDDLRSDLRGMRYARDDDRGRLCWPGACFADFGHTVTCVDKDPGKIERLEKGVMPIFEPGLAELVASNVKEGRLSFSLDAREAIKSADAVFIAVGTPSRRGDGHA